MAIFSGITSSNKFITLGLEVRETNIDYNNNTSDVYYRLFVSKSASSTSATAGSCSFSATINGSNVISQTKQVSVSVGKTTDLGSGTLRVAHNVDGSKIINVSASISGKIVGNVGGQLTLTTIPRANSITALNADIGSSTIITINKQAPSFTTTLTYSFGSLSGTIVTKTANQSYGWTIPTTFYAQIQDKPSGTCKITAETFNGDVSVGKKETTFTVTANKELSSPTTSITSVVDSNTNVTKITGDNKKIVNGYSNALITFTASPRNNTTLKSITINGNSVSTTATTYTISKMNTNKITITVTDKRDYTTTIEYNLGSNFIPYIPLTLTANIKRNQPVDNQVAVDYKGDFYNSGIGQTVNQLSVTYRYKLKDASSYDSWIALSPQKSGNTYSRTQLFTNASGKSDVFDYRNSYDFQVRVTDSINTTGITVQGSVTKGIPIIHWNGDKFVVEGDLYIKDQKVEIQKPDQWRVGDLCINISGENPSTRFGGTWELWGKGKTLVGYDANDSDFNQAGKTGGSKALQSHTHTGTTTANGAHVHSLNGYGATLGSGSAGWRFGSGGDRVATGIVQEAGEHVHTFTTNASGTGNSGNLQPYIVAYFWVKTA